MGDIPMFRSFGNMFRKYAVFRGRTDRAEYWWAILLYMIIFLMLFIPSATTRDESFMNVLGLFRLGTIVPYYALHTRRLHDIGKSGWWSLLGCNLIGMIVLIVWLSRAGDTDENLFGADPRPVCRY